MKKNLLMLTGLFFLSLAASAQSNLVVFSEDGDLFYAYINGIRQNDKPEANVKVTGLTATAASLRVEFADKALPQLKQNMQMEQGFEYAIRIKRDMKKQLKLRFFGQTPIGTDAATGAAIVPYHTTENTYNTATDNTSTGTNSNGNVSITSSTVTTTHNADPNNMAVNINMAGTGISMNATGMDPNTMNTTTSTTVTSTTSGSSYSGNNNNASNNMTGSTTTTSKAGCSMAMNSADFAKLKKSVESKPFTDTKMSTAKVATKNGCLSTSQIKEICKLFSMDDDKLIYAKYAYEYCMDKASYYQVSDVFTFSGTTDDFNKFLEQH